MSHPVLFADELCAEIDAEVLPLVRLFCRFPNVRTISSCQGNPGRIGPEDGGFYGHVTFQKGEWREVGEFCFDVLFPLFKDLWDDVLVEVRACATWGETWDGTIRFRNEAIPDVIERLQKVLP